MGKFLVVGKCCLGKRETKRRHHSLSVWYPTGTADNAGKRDANQSSLPSTNVATKTLTELNYCKRTNPWYLQQPGVGLNKKAEELIRSRKKPKNFKKGALKRTTSPHPHGGGANCCCGHRTTVACIRNALPPGPIHTEFTDGILGLGWTWPVCEWIHAFAIPLDDAATPLPLSGDDGCAGGARPSPPDALPPAQPPHQNAPHQNAPPRLTITGLGYRTPEYC